MRFRSLVAAWLCCLPVVAQARPVPTAEERAAVQAELLERLAAATTDPRFVAAPVGHLLAMTVAGDLAPALRYELLLHAERCARAAGDVPAGLRAASAMRAAFAVGSPEDAFLERMEAEGRAAPQQLVAGWFTILESRWSLLLEAPSSLDAPLAAAQRVAVRDVPPGLAAWVARRCRAFRESVTLAVPDRSEPTSDADVGGFRRAAYFRGEWFAYMPHCGEAREAFVLFASDRARTSPEVVGLAQSAEKWLLRAASVGSEHAARHLRRHAIDLMLPFARSTPTDETQRLETERLRRLVEQTTVLAVEPVLGEVRFVHETDLARLHIDGGRWSVVDGELRGESLGAEVATRATVRMAWGEIDAVTIRGGIRSGDGRNFRFAVGPVNVLLNWEVADENHAWFGDAKVVTAPRALVPGREHTIVVRQCGSDAVVAIDGRELFAAPAHLFGTITVYPAIGSEIFVKSIDVVGDPDLRKVVAGHGVAR